MSLNPTVLDPVGEILEKNIHLAPSRFSHRVSEVVRDKIHELRERFFRNGVPTHRIIREAFADSFEDITNPGIQFILRSVAGEIAGQFIDTLEKPHRILDVLPDEAAMVMQLVDSIGKGFTYFGSARTTSEHLHYQRTRQLAKEISLLFPESVTWTGAGPGNMEAALVGANEAGGKIAGIKIDLPGGFEQNVCPLLTEGRYTLHGSFQARKLGLTYACTPKKPNERTGLIVTPGGIGTLDEAFEVWTLHQTNKRGENYPSPFIFASYGGFYDDLYTWLSIKARAQNYVNERDLSHICLCRTNREILEELADFYEIGDEQRTFRQRIGQFENGQGDLFPNVEHRGFYRTRGISRQS